MASAAARSLAPRWRSVLSAAAGSAAMSRSSQQKRPARHAAGASLSAMPRSIFDSKSNSTTAPLAESAGGIPISGPDDSRFAHAPCESPAQFQGSAARSRGERLSAARPLLEELRRPAADFLRRQVFLVRRDRPVVSERVGHLAVAVA